MYGTSYIHTHIRTFICTSGSEAGSFRDSILDFLIGRLLFYLCLDFLR